MLVRYDAGKVAYILYIRA